MWRLIEDVTEVGNLQQAWQTAEGNRIQVSDMAARVHVRGPRGYGGAARQLSA